MYSDYTMDDILETASHFVCDTDRIYDEFSKNFDTWEQLYFTQLNNIFKNEELQNAAQKLLENEFKKLEDLKINLEKNKVYLQRLGETVSKLKDQKLKKENELIELKRNVDKIKGRLDDMEEIKKKTDIILAYKLLTNTSFVYNTKKITGIVEKNPPIPFSFNPQELSPEEITEKLWQLILGNKK